MSLSCDGDWFALSQGLVPRMSRGTVLVGVPMPQWPSQGPLDSALQPGKVLFLVTQGMRTRHLTCSPMDLSGSCNSICSFLLLLEWRLTLLPGPTRPVWSVGDLLGSSHRFNLAEQFHGHFSVPVGAACSSLSGFSSKCAPWLGDLCTHPKGSSFSSALFSSQPQSLWGLAQEVWWAVFWIDFSRY